MFSKNGEMPQSVPLQQELTRMHIEEWLKDDVFRPRWWALLAILLLSPVVWYLLLDKKRMKSACLYAAICAVFSMGFFEYGDELALWDYPVDIIPIFPPLTSINLLLRPLVFSILFQRFLSWKSFLIASLAASAALCFAVEPLLCLAGMYELANWNFLFSFAAYAVMAMLARFITKKLLSVAQRHGPQPEWQS